MHLNACSDLVAWTQISCYHAPASNTFVIHPTRCLSMCLAHLLGRACCRIVPTLCSGLAYSAHPRCAYAIGTFHLQSELACCHLQLYWARTGTPRYSTVLARAS